MERMKTLGTYALFVILFWIFSDILINVGINSTYKDMERRGSIPAGVKVEQMQSTAVNGRIALEVNDIALSGKYIKVDLYSESGINLGTQYLDVGTVKENQVKELETYFKISEVKSYEISVVDEMGTSTDGFMDTALSTISVVVIVIKFLLL